MSAYYYNEEYIEEIVGNGLSVTETFKNTKTNIISGTKKIHDSIYTILSTRIGERILLPEFGSRLHELIFEPNDFIFMDLAEFYIKDALGKWEKRIKVEDVNVEAIVKDNIVPITISYSFVNSNVSGTYVFPFKLNSFGNPEIYRQGDIEESEKFY